MRLVLHREIPEDPPLHRGWNMLVSKMDRPEVFYTCEWALAVQSAYRAACKPILLLGYDGQDLIGVASLCASASGNDFSFLAANTADYCDFLTEAAYRRQFVGAVFSELRNISGATITLANLPADSDTANALRDESRSRGCHVFLRPAYACAQIELGCGERRQELKNSLLRKKKLRRYLRELERAGPVTFAHLQTANQIEDALPAFAEAHVARFRSMGRVSSLSTAERRGFLLELSRRFDGQGVVTLSILKINDRAVAWNYGFQFHGSWFWYQPTFDSGLEKNSPGYCLLAKIVMEACDMESMEVVDLGLGAEGYKERFGNGLRHTLHATVHQSRVRHWREVVRFGAASLVKRSPTVESALRRVLRSSHYIEPPVP